MTSTELGSRDTHGPARQGPWRAAAPELPALRPDLPSSFQGILSAAGGPSGPSLAVVSVSFPVLCLSGCLQLTPASCQHLWVCFYRWRCQSSLWQVCPAGSCAKVTRGGHAFCGASNCQESLVLLQSCLFGCLCWVAIRMLVVKGTSGGFKSGSRVPASLEGGTSGCWGRPRAGEM